MFRAIKDVLRRRLNPAAIGALAGAGVAAFRPTRKGAYTAAALLAACGLGSCATFDAAKFAAAANELDPDCYKRTVVKVTPLLVFGWPVPIVSAEHEKLCHPELLAKPSNLSVGSLVQ